MIEGTREGLERLAKNQGKGEQKKFNLKIELIQPWSVPVFKTTLPPEVLQTMIEISDQVIADKDTKSAGGYLAGQIDTELGIELDILEQAGVLGFFQSAIRQFVIMCKCQREPNKIDVIQQEEYLTQLLTMWIISQQPGEYNPIHVHSQCTISTVMYLKVPKMLPSRKEHGPNYDGSILFVSNTSRDIDFCTPNIIIPPQVGDFYIFGSQQQHAVYPYRCAEGQKDVERRSISFNAVFHTRSNFELNEKVIIPIENLLKENKLDEAKKLIKNTKYLDTQQRNNYLQNIELHKKNKEKFEALIVETI